MSSMPGKSPVGEFMDFDFKGIPITHIKEVMDSEKSLARRQLDFLPIQFDLLCHSKNSERRGHNSLGILDSDLSMQLL
jgi:hypothetical protein